MGCGASKNDRAGGRSGDYEHQHHDIHGRSVSCVGEMYPEDMEKQLSEDARDHYFNEKGPESDGDECEESKTKTEIVVALKVAKARFSHGITGDADQFTADPVDDISTGMSNRCCDFVDDHLQITLQELFFPSATSASSPQTDYAPQSDVTSFLSGGVARKRSINSVFSESPQSDACVSPPPPPSAAVMVTTDPVSSLQPGDTTKEDHTSTAAAGGGAASPEIGNGSDGQQVNPAAADLSQSLERSIIAPVGSSDDQHMVIVMHEQQQSLSSGVPRERSMTTAPSEGLTATQVGGGDGAGGDGLGDRKLSHVGSHVGSEGGSFLQSTANSTAFHSGNANNSGGTPQKKLSSHYYLPPMDLELVLDLQLVRDAVIHEVEECDRRSAILSQGGGGDSPRRSPGGSVTDYPVDLSATAAGGKETMSGSFASSRADTPSGINGNGGISEISSLHGVPTNSVLNENLSCYVIGSPNAPIIPARADYDEVQSQSYFSQDGPMITHNGHRNRVLSPQSSFLDVPHQHVHGGGSSNNGGDSSPNHSQADQFALFSDRSEAGSPYMMSPMMTPKGGRSQLPRAFGAVTSPQLASMTTPGGRSTPPKSSSPTNKALGEESPLTKEALNSHLNQSKRAIISANAKQKQSRSLTLHWIFLGCPRWAEMDRQVERAMNLISPGGTRKRLAATSSSRHHRSSSRKHGSPGGDRRSGSTNKKSNGATSSTKLVNSGDATTPQQQQHVPSTSKQKKGAPPPIIIPN